LPRMGDRVLHEGPVFLKLIHEVKRLKRWGLIDVPIPAKLN